MAEFLLVIVLIVLFIRWLILSNRLAELKLRIDNIAEERLKRRDIEDLERK